MANLTRPIIKISISIAVILIAIVVFISYFYAVPPKQEQELIPGTLALKNHWIESDKVRIKNYKHQRYGFEDHKHWWKIDLSEVSIDSFIKANGLSNDGSGIGNLNEWMSKDSPDWWPESFQQNLSTKKGLDVNALVESDGEWYGFRYSD